MMKCASTLGLMLVAALMFNGLVASSASAQVFGCYQMSEHKTTAPKKGATWKTSACTERAAQLEGEYALVLLTHFKTDDLMVRGNQKYRHGIGRRILHKQQMRNETS